MLSIRPCAGNRKLEALRNLAERPGTPAEGEVARRMYERERAKTPRAASSGNWRERWSIPEEFQCSCGRWYNIERDIRCQDTATHERIRSEIRATFPKGTRVFYNYRAYELNSPATVVGYTRDVRTWGWIRLKFDHLTTIRAVPIRSVRGWHISTDKLPFDEARRMAS